MKIMMLPPIIINHNVFVVNVMMVVSWGIYSNHVGTKNSLLPIKMGFRGAEAGLIAYRGETGKMYFDLRSD